MVVKLQSQVARDSMTVKSDKRMRMQADDKVNGAAYCPRCSEGVGNKGKKNERGSITDLKENMSYPN